MTSIRLRPGETDQQTKGRPWEPATVALRYPV